MSDDIMHIMSGENTVDMVYLDFAKAFDKLDHEVLLHKIKTLGITGKLGVWLYHFLTHKTHFVRLQGGINHHSSVLSAVSQGTVLGPLLFINLMVDINCGISFSSIVSFADDSRNILDLGINVSNLAKRTKHLTGWMLRIFSPRDNLTILTSFKAIIISRLDYGFQLWLPYLIKHINMVEKVQRYFTRFISVWKVCHIQRDLLF